MHFELMKPRRGTSSPVFYRQFKKREWNSRPGGGINTYAIMGGIALNAVKVDICKVDIQRLRGADRR